MKHISLLTALFSLLLLITSCQKPITETECACTQQSNSAAKKLLTATTWQIEEVIDPIMGTRYKRGLTSDGKNFSAARYTYQENNTLTGIDWFGSNLTNTCYMLMDNDQKIKVVTPSCSSIEVIIALSANQFTYRSADGSIFKLVPRGQKETTAKK